MIGTTLSHFRILAKIGEGGMGVVYRAEDEKLRRLVALKVLPPDLVGNEERRLRFLREARAAAAVTHPNIATIYEVGEAPDPSGQGPGVVFIAMELVEGKTLRDLMGGGPLPLKDAVRLACEVAEGLAQAHQGQVVHRDLKPDNVAVTAAGHPKILDFGLAKVLEERGGAGGGAGAGGEAGGDAAMSQLRTISGEMTREGKIFGTAAYMSPEQARGKAVDARSDLFSFGTMLYEMVTGRLPFQGATATDVMSAIIRDEPPPVSQVTPGTPAELERIIGECLEKDPADRYQHTDQLAVDLRKLKRATDSGVQAVRTPSGPLAADRAPARGVLRGRRGRIAALGLGGAAIVLIVAVAGYRRWHAAPPALPSGGRVIVADFTNTTGRVEYDTAVRDAFERMLSRSAFVDVLGGATLQDLVRAKAGATVSRVDADLARRLCSEGACVGFFTGGVAPNGNGVSVQAALQIVGGARPSITRSATAGGDEEVLAAIHALVLDIRRDLGESPRAVAATPPPATRSLQAYSVYALGMMAKLRADEQLPLLRRAIEVDPSFVDAYQELAVALYNQGDVKGFREAAEEAYRRSATLPEQLRLRGETLYYDAFYDYERELESFKRYTSLYPYDYVGHSWQAFIHAWPYGDWASSEKSRRAAYELHPDAYQFLALCQTLAPQGKGTEIDRLLEEFRSRRNDAGAIADCALQAALGRDDIPAALDQIAGIERSGAPSAKAGAAYFRAPALERRGRLEEARAAVGSAEALAVQVGDLGMQHDLMLDSSWLEMRRTGRTPALPARVADLAVTSLYRLRDLAVFSVETGLTDPLQRVIEVHAADLRGSKSRFVAEELDFARACLAFTRGQLDAARALLEPIARGSLLSVRHHALGRVYEAMALWREAAAQYEEVLKHPWLNRMFPAVWTLDQYRLARVYDRLGDAARARHRYQRFVDDWKDADPDIPELIDARQRLQALGGAADKSAGG